jgi:hypothetical protein
MLKRIIYIIIIIPQLISATNKDSIAEIFVKYISIDELNNHLFKLASDEFEGRGTGELGQYFAADYIKNHFYNIGLKGLVNDTGYFQKYIINKMEIPDLNLSINNIKYQHLSDYYLFNQNKYILPKSYKLKKLFTIYNLNELKNKHNKYKESAIFYNYTSIDTLELINNYIKLIDECNKNNINLIFLLKPKIEFFEINYKLRSELFKREINPKIPIIFINDTLKLKKRNRINFVIKPKFKNVETQNVIGFIKGKIDETIVISSHFDHLGKKDGKIFYGADDNASGTSAVLNIATAFSKAQNSGYIPYRNILFITFSGEEIGLLGSNYYTENPVIPLTKTVVNINIDMVGRKDNIYKNDEKYIYVIGSDKLSKTLHKTNEEVNATYQNLILDYKYNEPNDPNRFYYRSDHYNFAKNNIPVIFFFNGLHDDYHKFTDTPDKIEFDLMEYRVKHFFLLAWKLANMKESITVDINHKK